MGYRLILLLIFFPLLVVANEGNKNSKFDQYKNAYAFYIENENNFDATYSLAVASIDVSQLKQARALVKRLLTQRPNEPRAILLYAKIDILEHQYDVAGEKLGTLLNLYPDTPFIGQAYDLIELIRKTKSKFINSYMLAAKIGFDSNPAQMNHDNLAIADFIFQDIGPALITLDDIDRSSDAFTEVSAAGNYLHDFGERGTWFAQYNWDLYGKYYTKQVAYDHSRIKGGGAIGYATQKSGQWLFGANLGIASSNIDNRYSANGYQYATFTGLANYNYKISNSALFTFGYSHDELSSFDQFPYDDFNPDTNTTTTRYESRFVHNIDRLMMQLDGQVFGKDKYKVQIFLQNFNSDERDMNGTTYYQVPYSHYQESGLNISYDHGYTARINFIFDLYLSTKRYQEYYLPYNMIGTINPPVDYDFAADPSEYYRKDEYWKLTLAASYKHSDKYISSLSYALSENKTNFTPAAYMKHELVYAFYWLP